MAGLTCFFLFSIFLVNNVLSRPNPSSNPSPSPSSTTVVQMRSASLDPEYEKDVLKECARVRLEVEEVPEGKREEVLIKKYAMERVDHEKTKEDKNSAVKDKVVVIDVLLPYVAFVKSRGHIEHLERVFGLAYSHPKNLSPKMLKSSTQMYEYHLMIWEWIWDNCQDPRFLTIKKAAIKEFNNDVPKAKLLVTTSYAGCFLGTSGTLHLPKRLIGLNVTIDDLVAALDDFQDLDADSRTCIKLAWL